MSFTLWLRTISAVALVAVAVVVTSITFGAGLRPSHKTPAPETVSAAAPVAAAPVVPPALAHLPLIQGNSDRNVSILVLQLRDGGFVPGEVTRPLGNYELIITNASQEREGTLQLERENGQRLEILKLERRNIRKVVRFTPGNYILRVTNQPTWLSRITITER